MVFKLTSCLQLCNEQGWIQGRRKRTQLKDLVSNTYIQATRRLGSVSSNTWLWNTLVGSDWESTIFSAVFHGSASSRNGKLRPCNAAELSMSSFEYIGRNHNAFLVPKTFKRRHESIRRKLCTETRDRKTKKVFEYIDETEQRRIYHLAGYAVHLTVFRS